MADQQDSKRSKSRIPSNDDVARRAYELFQARGGEPGNDLENWLQAERELNHTPDDDVHVRPRLPRRKGER
jgi:hypothetical protein